MTDGDGKGRVGVLGASSFVGARLMPLLAKDGWHISPFSRRAVGQTVDGLTWKQLPFCEMDAAVISHWVCVAPIWVLPDYFDLLISSGARRVVVLSSTSRFTKGDSSDPQEQTVARRLTEAEILVQDWAQSHGVEFVILRPTLIYELGRDKNVTEIARFIGRFGFFPLVGNASGLRQPIHAGDVAGACLAALQAPCAANRTYNISGGETLTYRDMVIRVFHALKRRPRLLIVPRWSFQFALATMRFLPSFRHWSMGMVDRMNRDLVFDHAVARRDLHFEPVAFTLKASSGWTLPESMDLP